VTESIRDTLELPVVLEKIVRVVCEDLRAKGCAISLVEGRSKILETRASNGLSDGFVEQFADVVSEDLRKEVIAGASVAVFDGGSDPRILQPDLIKREKISSILLIPLMSRRSIIGVLSLFTHKPYFFSADEMQLMASIGEQCSLAIDNAKMFEALKKRYELLVDDFQLWFEHTQSYPQRGPSV
jgi:GAF domain-containing protein